MVGAGDRRRRPIGHWLGAVLGACCAALISASATTSEARAFSWNQPNCPVENLFSGSGDGRGPGSGPFTWFTAPTLQPPVADNPLSGKPWFVDCQWDESWIGSRVRVVNRAIVGAQSQSTAAKLTSNIASQPIAKWFGPTHEGMYTTVRKYLERTAFQAPGAVRFVVFRRLESGNCAKYSKPDQSVYGPRVHARLVEQFAAAVRDVNSGQSAGPLVVIIEPDIMPSLGCIPKWAHATRIGEIRHAINAFKDLPQTTTYLDAGASDWWGWKTLVNYLKTVGVQKIRGFSLNVTHYDWTRDNVAYGTEMAKRLGVHFVVSTARSGGGNLPESLRRAGYEGGCNIPNAGIGQVPTVQTANRWVDAYLWLLNPGFSDGNCRSGRNYRTAGVMWSEKLALDRIARRCQSGPRCYGRGKVTIHS